MSQILTVSDAHILDRNDPAGHDLCDWIARHADAEAVVFNGDIFEFFVGRQRMALQQYRHVLDQIGWLANRVQVVFIQGNHDFHLRRALPESVLVADRWEATLGGERTLWLHGDTLAPSAGYRLLRRLLRSTPTRVVTEQLPARFVWWVATNWAHTSRTVQEDPHPGQLADKRPQVAKLLSGSYDRLITGHFHLYHRERMAGGEWLVLGDWRTGRWYHRWDETGAEVHQWGQ